jgi:peptidoglycan/LPS O-acetylase OafA/YrhL
VKISQITFTRFLAALAIVIFHYGEGAFVYKIKYISEIFAKANIGVSYFFILSGFIMIVAYHSKEKINYIDFYRNRVARIYPLYVIGLILYLFTRSQETAFFPIIAYLSGVQSWLPGKALILNFPGWSISVEFFFYLIFPFLYNYIYSKNYKFIWITAVLIWIATQVFCNYFMFSGLYEGRFSKSHDFISYFPLLHINEFLIGNLAGIFFVKNFKQKNYDWAIFLVFSLILFSLLFVPLYYHDGLMAVFFVPLIVLISLNNGFLTRIMSIKPLEYMGEISYAIYIVHIPVLFILRSFLWDYFRIYDRSIIFWIYIPVLIIISGIFYQLIEKPCRDYLKKIKFG